MSDAPDQPSPHPPPQPRQNPPINVSVPPEVRHGTYANFLAISHSPHEFTLDFCQVMPSGEGTVTAEVVDRIRIAPTMVGRMIQALNTNMTTYEERFGMVRDVG